jgi:hypothetical protein
MASDIPEPTSNTSRTKGNPTRNNPLPQNIRNDAIAINPASTSVPELKVEELNTWLSGLYNVNLVTDDELKTMFEAFSYKGFNRADVLKQLQSVVPDQKTSIQIVIVGALRGPQAGSKIKLLNGKTCIEMGIPASGGQGTKILTLNKIISATADLAAFYLKKFNAPKRINSLLPGWLQFPSAGSIKLPTEIREQHIEFSKKFSVIIGGLWQEQIYMQMMANSYLDPTLHLFE